MSWYSALRLGTNVSYTPELMKQPACREVFFALQRQNPETNGWQSLITGRRTQRGPWMTLISLTALISIGLLAADIALKIRNLIHVDRRRRQ
jgi:hypothetical protein